MGTQQRGRSAGSVRNAHAVVGFVHPGDVRAEFATSLVAMALQGKTRIDAKCRKCGAPNRVSANQGELRVAFTCKECGEKQVTL